MKFLNRFVAVSSLGLLGVSAWADTTSLPLTDDAWINANNPGANFGTVEDIFVHSYGPKYGLVRFDAASISGQTVNSATLELYLSSIRESGDISLHAITSSWNETTVTWNNQPPAEAVATAVVGLTTGDAGGTVAIDVTAAVQRWADGSLADAGFLIATSDGIKSFFDAKEMSGGVPATLTVDYSGSTPGGPTGVGTPPVVLDLSSPPVVIDEPGHYVIDRDWEVDSRSGPITMIEIQASNVLLDLQGLTILTGQMGGPLIHVTGDRVIVRNGSLIQDSGVGDIIYSEGRSTHLHDLTINNEADGIEGNAVVMNGDLGRVVNCHANATIILGNSSRWSAITSSEVNTYEAALIVAGSNATIAGNFLSAYRVGSPTAIISGDENSFTQNTVEYGDEVQRGLVLSGDDNVVLANLFDPYAGESPAVYISGTRNLLKGNIVASLPPPQGPSQVGFVFAQNGNSYGNNTVSAVTSFAVGSTTQVDLGGNTSY